MSFLYLRSALVCLCRRLNSTVTTTDAAQNISPPPRIPRGPTDILQALASTVSNDPTAPHYKYHDDPYLIPLNNFKKRAFALSRESGRKAAVWIRDQHPELFNSRVWDPPTRVKTPHFNADPKIEAYAPKPFYDENSEISEEVLTKLINNAFVEDSIKVFVLLGGVDKVSEGTRRSLLELVSFYNEREPGAEEWIEERWFAQNVRNERPAATWKTGGLAEELFNSLEVKDSAAYCAIIQGMCKYYQAERAYDLSRRAQEEGVSLNTSSYNALLSVVGFLREGSELRKVLLLELLTEMKHQCLSPDTHTLSSCLYSLGSVTDNQIKKQLSTQLLAEFRRLGVETNLTAYYHMLRIFCKERGPRADILTPILNELDKKERLESSDPKDTYFFVTAMSVCNEHLQDIDIAERLHALLLKGDNYRLLGDAYKESVYYRHLVSLAFRRGDLQRALKHFDTLVPHAYVPEPTVMDEIINVLEFGLAGDRLAEAWSQLVMFNLSRRIGLVEHLLSALANTYEHQDEEVKEKMRNAAADIWKRGQPEEDTENEMRTPPLLLSAVSLGQIVELCSDTASSLGVWESARGAVQQLVEGRASGVPSSPAGLQRYVEKALEFGEPSAAVSGVRYMWECGFPDARPAALASLRRLLNRPEQELLQLAAENLTKLHDKVDPNVLQLLTIYSQSSGDVGASARDSSSSDSDSDSSDSDSDPSHSGDHRKQKHER